MALWLCLACGCRYAVGLPACPQCWSESFEEADVPRPPAPPAPAPAVEITGQGGVTLPKPAAASLE